MKLDELIKPLTGVRLIGDSSIEIKGLEYDSRRLKPGMLFAAITGYRVDGKAFISDAVKNGAAAILTDSEIETEIPVIVVGSVRKALADMAACFYGYPGQRLNVVGVTGTNGKSTSVFLIKNIIEHSTAKAGMINSLIYDTGAGQYKAERTTPDSLEVQRFLSEMERAGCTYAVIEVSSHALVLSRVENIDFKVGLFTNFSRDHLDFHKTMGAYLDAKRLFLEKLEDKDGIAVINRDIPEFISFINEARGKVVTYSTESSEADITVSNVRLSQGKSTFRLNTADTGFEMEIKLPGRYNLVNAVGAAAVGFALGMDADIIAGALVSSEPVPGRFQPVKSGQPFSVIIDYAHTPDALARLCLSAREISEGKVLLLFGCGGDRDRGKRPLMAEAASRNSDFTVLTSDNPRTEDPGKIFEDTIPGMIGSDYQVIPDRREAISAIIKRAGDNDIVLIAGKGAEDYQEIGTTRYPFSDKTEIMRVLETIGYKKVNAG